MPKPDLLAAFIDLLADAVAQRLNRAGTAVEVVKRKRNFSTEGIAHLPARQAGEATTNSFPELPTLGSTFG